MLPLISTLSLIGIVLAFQVFARIRAELAPLTACTTAIAIVYIAALGDVLAPITVVLYVAGLVSALAGIWKLCVNPPANRDGIVVSLVVFAAGALVAWICLSGQAYGSWDEFSHWGRISKAIASEAALPGHSTGVMLKDYPPATALFHFFVLFSRFSEGGTYFAQALLLISCAIALTRWERVAMAPVYVLVLVVALLLFASLGQGYATLEVDHVLGGMFGAVAGTIAVGDRHIRNRCALIPMLFCMPLIKTIGVLPALCAAAAVFAVDVLGPLIIEGSRNRSWNTWRRPLGIACILLLVPIAAHQSWAARVRAFNFNQTFSVKFDVAGLLTLATPSQRSPAQQQVVENFGRALRSAPVGRNGNGILSASGAWQGGGDRLPPSTALQWLSVMSALSLIVYALQPGVARVPYASVLLMLAAGCVGYILLLLYVYVFGFGSHEGIRVISFGRYVSTWFLAWGLVLAAALGQAARGTGPQQAVGLLFLVVATSWATVRAPHQDPASAIVARSRAAIHATTARVEGQIPPGAGTYVVWQQTEGFQFNVVAYELSPRATNSWCWTLGEKYHPGDAWTCPLSAEEFAVKVKDFDYLLLMQGDDQFWNRYRSLFAQGGADDERKSRLFHVSRVGDSVQFRRVSVP